MRYRILVFITSTILGLGGRIAAQNRSETPIGPVRTATTEPGVVPPGTSLIIRTEHNVRTRNAYRTTIYRATIAEDVLDQNGTVLIPTESHVELVVRSLPYLGPGGVGMTLLTLDLDAVTVRGVRYPVETHEERPGAGGIGVDRGAAVRVGRAGEARDVVTRGPRIDVPAETLLAFQIQAPIRLGGF